jgi:sulfonate transport system permease protein
MTRAGLMRLGVWILILLAWEGAYRLIKWDRTLFPSPLQVLDGGLELLNIRTGFGNDFGPNWPKALDGGFGPTGDPIYRGALITASLTSLIRLGVGFAISIVLGGILGAAMWRIRGLDEFLGPLFLGFQTLPSVCWVPLALLWFGQTEHAMLFVVIMGTVWSVVIATDSGARSIPPIYARAARTMGSEGLDQWVSVILPAALPFLVSGMKQGWAFAWRSLMAAEIYVTILTGFGLGHLLHYGRELNDMNQVIGVMLVIVVIGLLADKILFSPWERFFHRRWGTGLRG